MSATVPLATPEPLRGLLAQIVDGPTMCEHLQQGLAGLCPLPFSIVECVAKPARSRDTLKQKKTLRVNYKVTVETADGVRHRHTMLGTVPVGPEYLQQLRGVHRPAPAHPAAAPFTGMEAYLAELRMAVSIFPADPTLPAAAQIMHPEGARVLEPHLPECRDGARITGLAWELRHYKPCNRCVIRVTAELSEPPGRRNVYVKIFADDRGAAMHRSSRGLWEAARGAQYLRMPEPLGYDADRRMLVMAEAPGDRALTAWIKCLEDDKPLPHGVDRSRVERALVVAARAAAELHRCRVALTGRRTFPDELVHLRKDYELVRHGAPEFADRVDRLLDRLEGATPAGERLVPSHGGYRHKQLVGDETNLSVIDWDGLTAANPALDGATFLRRLTQEHLRRPDRAGPMVELAALFRRELLAAEPDLSARQLSLYEAVSLTEHALRSFSRPKKKEAVKSELHRVFEAVERLLDGAPAAWH